MVSSTILMAARLIGGGQLLSNVGKETLLLMGYNYAINGVILTIIPSIANSWIEAIIVVTIGCIFALIARKYTIIKKILI